MICNTSCVNKSYPVKETLYDSIIDDYSWKLAEQQGRIIQLEDSLQLYKDSVEYNNIIIDSLEIELSSYSAKFFIDEYKLERIAEYNRIAGQGNNITFLRGWINRVLND